MTKQFFAFLLLALLVLEVGGVLAQGLTPYNPFLYGIKRGNPEGHRGFLPQITECGQVQNGLRSYDFGTCALYILNKILAVIYTIALFIGVIYLVYAGILYITSGGNAAAVHSRLLFGIVGVVVAVVSFSAVKAIEYSLTQGEGGFVAGGSTTSGGAGGGGVSAGGLKLVRATIDPNNVLRLSLTVANSATVACALHLDLNNDTKATGPSEADAQLNASAAASVAANLPTGSQIGDNITVTLSSPSCSVSPTNFNFPLPDQGGLVYGSGGATGTGGATSAGTGSSALPQLVIETDTVSLSSTNQINFVAYLNRAAAGVNCAVNARVANLTSGISEQTAITVDANPDFRTATVPLGTRPGQTLRLYLTASQCQTPNAFTYTVPGSVAGGTNPIISLGQPRVLGQQNLVVQLPQNIEQAFIQALDIFLRQARLFDGPFYITFRYQITPALGQGQVPQRSGTCTLTFNLAGARVLSTSISPIPATSIKFFNSIQTISIPIEVGRTDYAKTFPLGLSNGLIEVVKIRGIDLIGCQYQGAGGQTDISTSGNQGGWQYRVNVTAQ